VRTHCGDDGVEIGAGAGDIAEHQRQLGAEDGEIGIAAVIARILDDHLGADDGLGGTHLPPLALDSARRCRALSSQHRRGTAAYRALGISKASVRSPAARLSLPSSR
jgi:hypothetical protein